jgi:hypothetical protein
MQCWCITDFMKMASPVITRQYMSYCSSSREKIAAPKSLCVQRTLADILSSESDPDRRSALRTAARLLGKPPQHVPADCRALGKALAEIVPAQHDVSRRRVANVRSLVSRSLEYHGVTASKPSKTVSQAWLALLKLLPGFDRVSVSYFSRWCSAHNIEPIDVNQAIAETFLGHLETETLRARPRGVFLTLRRDWNRAVQSVPR